MRSTALPPLRRDAELVVPGKRRHRARRRAPRGLFVVVVVVVAVVVVVVSLVLAWRASQPSFTSLPTPVLGDASAPTVPTVPTMPSASTPPATITAATTPPPATTAPPATAATTAPLAAASPTGATAPTQFSYAPSQAIQIYVPNTNPDLVISTSVQPLGGCRSVIDPPRSGPGWAGVFGCSDFAQPGTATPSLAVLAGHSSRSLDTVFNKLYRQGTALENQMVYLRTQDSGDHWLSYRVQHTYVPDKDELPYMTAVWGGDGSSTAGRLVLVTCQQTDTGSESTANYVAVAQFVGVM